MIKLIFSTNFAQVLFYKCSSGGLPLALHGQFPGAFRARVPENAAGQSQYSNMPSFPARRSLTARTNQASWTDYHKDDLLVQQSKPKKWDKSCKDW